MVASNSFGKMNIGFSKQLLVLVIAIAISIHAQGRIYAPQPPINAMASDTTAVPPDMLLTNIYAQTINVKDLKGKVIFINFWALSCIPCKEEMPTIDRLKQQFQDNPDVVIISINLDDDIKKAIAYFKQREYTLDLYSVAGPVPEVIFGGDIPTTVVLDKTGKIVFSQVGKYEYDSAAFISRIAALAHR